MGLETDAETLLRTVDAPGLTNAEAVRLAQSLRGAALVIQGDADAITPPERGRELARRARAELVMLAGAGHEPQCRDPERVNAIVDDFLRRRWPVA